MMMGEAEMETRRAANDYGLDTATITILQPKRLEKKDYRGRKKI